MDRMGVEEHENVMSLLSRQTGFTLIQYWRNCDAQVAGVGMRGMWHEAVVNKARLGSLTSTLWVMRQPNRLVAVTFGHFWAIK